MRVVAVLMLLLLAACASSADIRRESAFRPTGPDTFQWQSYGHAGFAEGDAESERRRLAVLAELLEVNEMCPHGFDIDQRQLVVVEDSLVWGKSHRIFYDGRCRPAS